MDLWTGKFRNCTKVTRPNSRPSAHTSSPHVNKVRTLVPPRNVACAKSKRYQIRLASRRRIGRMPEPK